MNLDREGIFKARPMQWRVQPAKETASLAIAVEYLITAKLDENNQWEDWTSYQEMTCWGYHYVVQRDGKPNVTTVQQLSESLGWSGSLKDVLSPPPEVEVQITVKANTYNNKTTYRAEWVNPGDYQPTGGGADESEVTKLEARFGSLLRAAASSKPKAPGKKPAPKPEPAPVNPEDIPF